MEAVLKEIECGEEAGVRTALADFNDKVCVCGYISMWLVYSGSLASLSVSFSVDQKAGEEQG